MRYHINLKYKQMKLKNFFAAVLLTACACGCGQKMNEPDVEKNAEEAVTLDVSVPLKGTKATDISGERTVGSLQVFVFRKDGTLEAEAREEGQTISLSCTTGEKDVYAIVNAPVITDVMTLENLKWKESFLTENAPGAFVMSGKTSVTLSASTSVEIEVKRLVARISIKKIVNNFTLDQYRTGALRIKGIYLLNVQSMVKYLGGVHTLLWCNLHSYTPETLSSLLNSGNLDIPLDYGTPYEETNYFYCYPNPIPDDTSLNNAQPRFTRLVVEVDMNGTSYYYPVSIPGIESNRTYEITELTLTRLGSASPDEPVSSLAASFTLKVLDWDPGTTLEPVI